MGIADKLNRFSNQLQQGAKNTSQLAVTIALKVMTAFFVSLTFTIVAQELMGFSSLSFTFVFLLSFALLFRIMAKWTMGAVLIFDLICVLVALLLRMYIVVAP